MTKYLRQRLPGLLLRLTPTHWPQIPLKKGSETATIDSKSLSILHRIKKYLVTSGFGFYCSEFFTLPRFRQRFTCKQFLLMQSTHHVTPLNFDHQQNCRHSRKAFEVRRLAKPSYFINCGLNTLSES